MGIDCSGWAWLELTARATLKLRCALMSSASDWHWHARAFLARRRWAATRQRLEDWLLGLPAGAAWPHELVLLGGSAGWMMSSRFLARFERVLLVDIDPWAGRLFRFNHGAALARHGVRLDVWQGDAHALLEQALAERPEACVLFDNFLGLDSMYTRDLKATERRLRAVRERVRGRLWGSVHDRLSGPGTTGWTAAACWQAGSISARAGEPLPPSALASVQASGEWIDHGTEPILPPGTPTWLIPWPIVAGRWHWLEAGWVDARGSV